jgi:hypothetical protein
MHAYLRRALCAVGLTGGIVLLGIGLAEAASADGPSGPVTTGESGILSGNQTGVDAQAPINASGNQVTVIGQRNQVHSTAGSASGAPAGTSTSPPAPTTSGRAGILSGNQTAIGLQVPVNVSGNQVTVIGQDNTVSSLGGSATGMPAGTSSGSPTSGPVTSGQDGILSGNQTGVGVLAPIGATGNQITVIGQDNTLTSTGTTTTGGSTTTGGTSGSGGGTTSPPGGTVVSPPTAGGSGGSTGAQAVSGPADSALPNTGAPAGLLGAGLLGLLLTLLGGAILRREEADL